MKNTKDDRVGVKRGVSCHYCGDGSDEGVSAYPYYGLAPHSHFEQNGPNKGFSVVFEAKEKWPDNYKDDPDAEFNGTYTHCLDCGGCS